MSTIEEGKIRESETKKLLTFFPLPLDFYSLTKIKQKSRIFVIQRTQNEERKREIDAKILDGKKGFFLSFLQLKNQHEKQILISKSHFK